MVQGRRYGLSAEQRTDIWRRWKAGESLHEIGRAFGKDHGSIQFLLSQHGGIAPAVRRETMRMKKHPQYFISKRLRRSFWVSMTIGIDLGDIWSHYYTLSEDGEVIDRGRFRTNPSGVDKRFRDLEPVRVAMEAGTHSMWVSEQIRELGHELIMANARELRTISHCDRKSDQVDAEKVARYARLDPEILCPIAHRTVAQQET